MAETDPTQMLLTLLAGVGLTNLPKLIKGMQPGQGGGARQGAAPASGGTPSAALLGPFLQMLQAQGGAMPGQPPEPASGPQPGGVPPAVPRFPVLSPVPGRTSPIVPRVAQMDMR